MTSSPGLNPLHQVFRYGCNHQRAAFGLHRAEGGDTAGNLWRKRSHISRSTWASTSGSFNASTGTPATTCVSTSRSSKDLTGQLAAQAGSLVLGLGQLLQQLIHPGGRFFHGGSQQAGNVPERPGAGLHQLVGPRPVTASMRRMPAAALPSLVIRNKPDIAGLFHVRAAAQLVRERSPARRW